MKTSIKVGLLILLCIIVIIIGIGVGSVSVELRDTVNILLHKIFGRSLSADISDSMVSIVWNLRVPRVLMAFIVGAALGVSGTVMQSVLKNPLASSYTLGVSSGASLGAALIIVTGFSLPLLNSLTLPFVGMVFGVSTVIISVNFAQRMDRNLDTNTIILVGMVFSLFINALLTLITALSRDKIAQLTYWQMGSFSAREWSHVFILLPIVIIGILSLINFTKEMDILTFGEDQAFNMGVDTSKMKWILLGLAAGLTGSAISFVGVIGFIDLIAPHIVRRIFGSSHRKVVPMSALFGGAFMVVCDILARSLLSPRELPVGAITAIIGAPFFAYIYFSKRKVS